MRSILSHNRELYRLWFEYLQLAHHSKDPAVKAALEQSAEFYAPWGDVTDAEFETWWPTQRRIFEEKYQVRELRRGQRPRDPDALIVEIPLTQAATTLAKHVREIIQQAFDDRGYPRSGKAKKAPSSLYKPTAGSEPKLLAVHNGLIVYRDVYLRNPALRGRKLLSAAHQVYKNRSNKKIPTPLHLGGGYSGPERALRNLRRYIQRAQQIMLNVANGSFPGEY